MVSGDLPIWEEHANIVLLVNTLSEMPDILALLSTRQADDFVSIRIKMFGRFENR